MNASTATVIDFVQIRAQRQLERRRVELAQLRAAQLRRWSGLAEPMASTPQPEQREGFRGVVTLAR